MGSSGEHFKIFRTIIEAVMVFVMNVLARFQRSAKHLFGNQLMLIDRASCNFVSSISLVYRACQRRTVVRQFYKRIAMLPLAFVVHRTKSRGLQWFVAVRNRASHGAKFYHSHDVGLGFVLGGG